MVTALILKLFINTDVRDLSLVWQDLSITDNDAELGKSFRCNHRQAASDLNVS